MKNSTINELVAKLPGDIALYPAILNLIYILVLPSFYGEFTPTREFITYTPQIFILIPTGIVLLFSMFRGDWLSGFLTVGTIILASFTILGFTTPQDKADIPHPDMRVMTYNILHGDKGVEEVADAITEHEPDVVCLQEANSRSDWNAELPGLAEALKEYKHVQYGELRTFSKFEIVATSAPWLSQVSGTHALVTRIRAGSGTVDVVNMHLTRREEAERLETEKKASGVRAEEVQNLRKINASLSQNLVVAGDFNSPPRGSVYELVTQGLNDTFKMAGVGFGYTYPAKIPLERIDYIFTKMDAKVSDCYSASEKASDHRPVVADISF